MFVFKVIRLQYRVWIVGFLRNCLSFLLIKDTTAGLGSYEAVRTPLMFPCLLLSSVPSTEYLYVDRLLSACALKISKIVAKELGKGWHFYKIINYYKIFREE